MNGKEDLTGSPVQLQQPKKKGPLVLAILVAIGMSCTLFTIVWINWSKPGIKPEPLTPELKTAVQSLPGTSDAIIYVGLKDIRQSRFWNEVLPDSIRHKPLFHTSAKLDAFMQQRGINLTDDLDTLLLSYQKSGRKQQKFIGVAWGSFAAKLPVSALQAEAVESAEVSGRKIYALDNNLWICPLGSRQIVVASSRQLLEDYLHPAGKFLDRDPVSASLIDKAVYKSHLWFALPSPLWTIGALQSLTSGNQDVQSVGNINRIQQIALSVKFDDIVKVHSEWIYNSRSSAFFASNFLWGTILVASNPNTRTPETAKALLRHLKVHQNLESVILTAELPMSGFKKTTQTAKQ
jgi:hypothetical protein